MLDCERSHLAPVKTGEALLQVVMNVLLEIQASFRRADATSRALLARAESEKDVQEWLTEQLNLRSSGRFHAHREAQVANGKKPDVIVSSTSTKFEVAIEVKYGEKASWTVKKLEHALENQLTAAYLKPVTRRWGIFFASHRGKRSWRDPSTKAKLSFHQVVQRLRVLATKLDRNEFDPVEVRVFGLDASPNNTRDVDESTESSAQQGPGQKPV